jgi:drug/metabolite transporter (DMT)-like permease
VAKRPHPVALYTGVLAMIAFWNMNFLFGKIALRYIDGFTLASFRLVLAGALMIPIYFLAPGKRSIDRRDLWALAGLGLIGVVFNQGGFTLGLSFTTAGHSSIIVGTAPIMVLLMARLQGMEQLDGAKVGGMALAFTGISILAAEHGLSFSSSTLRGDLITFSSTTAFAIYTIYGKKLAAKYDAVAMIASNSAAAAIIVMPLAVHQAVRLDWRRVAWQGWGGVVYMAVMSSIVSYMIFYWALRHMPASRLAAFSYLEPLFVVTTGVLLLGEKLTPSLFVGGAFTLAGVYLTERGLGDRTPPPEPV